MVDNFSAKPVLPVCYLSNQIVCTQLVVDNTNMICINSNSNLAVTNANLIKIYSCRISILEDKMIIKPTISGQAQFWKTDSFRTLKRLQ